MDKYVSARQFAHIMDVDVMSVYFNMHPDKKIENAQKKSERTGRTSKIETMKYFDNYQRPIMSCTTKLGYNYFIDIEKYLHENKYMPFEFIHEKEKRPFMDYFINYTEKSIDDYPEWIGTKDIKALLEITTQKLITLRKNKAILFRVLENNNYPSASKGRLQYEYNRNSVIAYCAQSNITLNPVICKEYNIRPYFMTVAAATQKCSEKLQKVVHQSKIYRLVNKGLIPSVIIGRSKRIPIREFKKLDLHLILYGY